MSTIKTKFNIGDFVTLKVTKQQKGILVFYQILHVQSDTCYAETQTRYLCRGYIKRSREVLMQSLENEHKWMKKEQIEKEVTNGDIAAYKDEPKQYHEIELEKVKI